MHQIRLTGLKRFYDRRPFHRSNPTESSAKEIQEAVENVLEHRGRHLFINNQMLFSMQVFNLVKQEFGEASDILGGSQLLGGRGAICRLPLLCL